MASRRIPLVFQGDERRFTLFPIQHDDIWRMYKQAEASFWTAEEIDLGSDRMDALEPDTRAFIERVLAFFSWADGVVVENLCENFACEVQLPEARCFFGFQIAMENIHSETYSLLIDTFASREDKPKLFGALNDVGAAALRKKADWMLAWMRADNSFAERLIAFACVEGIHFSAAFSAIFWLKKRGLPMAGLFFSNELISRDEGMHCDFACLLHSKLLARDEGPLLPSSVDALLVRSGRVLTSAAACDVPLETDAGVHEAMRRAFPHETQAWVDDASLDIIASLRANETTILEIIRSACTCEFEFLEREALPVRLIGMNADCAKDYVRFVANRLAGQLGAHEVPFPGVDNPFDWMQMISLSGKANFFERRVSDYQKAGVMESLRSREGVGKEFKIDVDF